MTLTINNKPTLTEATNLSDLAIQLALPEKGVAVAISNIMIPRTEWPNTILTEGANIVIIKAACGG